MAALAAVAAAAAAASPADAKGGAGAPVPQVIAFPSRDFVSVAEPGVGDPCWTASLTPPSSNMSPGDKITVSVPGGAGHQQLSKTVADVRTVQAQLAAGSSTKVVVTGSAKDSVTGLQIGGAGLLEVRLIAKRSQFTFNGRRDLRAAIGGGGDGVLTYDVPGSTTNFSFTVTFEVLGGKKASTALASADATHAVRAQTRGLVQNDPASPTPSRSTRRPSAVTASCTATCRAARCSRPQPVGPRDGGPGLPAAPFPRLFRPLCQRLRAWCRRRSRCPGSGRRRRRRRARRGLATA